APSTVSYQISFRANWSWRLLAAVLLMLLKAPILATVSGPVGNLPVGSKVGFESANGVGIEKMGGFRKVKASKRKWSFRRSVMGVGFMELKSKLTYVGPRSALRPAVPKTSWGSA